MIVPSVRRAKAWSAKDLVDVRNGLVSREVFVDDEVFRYEQENLFARAWLFVGHESQVPNAGDYFASYMGDNPVIVARDRQGEIHVFLNSCRHRGMKVCRYDEGNTAVFMCPYHGWTYGLRGELTGVPYYKEGYHEELDKAEWGLIHVAQLCNYRGSLWATWDAAAPPFLDYIGDFRVFLDGLFESYNGTDGATGVIAGIQKWRIPANWKFVSENFAGDHNHGAVTHQSVEAVGIGPGRAGETRHGDTQAHRAHLTFFPHSGHCWRGGPPQPIEHPAYPFPKFENPQVEAYFRRAAEVRQTRPDKWPPVSVFGGGGNVFPNMSFHVAFPRTIVVAHPRGARVTELWRWFLFDRDAPAEVRDHFRRYNLRYAGPAGMTEQDDMENWCYATEASTATIARRYAYNYQQALGRWSPAERLRGAWVTDGPYGEANVLTVYKRWAEFMDAEGWDDLAPPSDGGSGLGLGDDV